MLRLNVSRTLYWPVDSIQACTRADVFEHSSKEMYSGQSNFNVFGQTALTWATKCTRTKHWYTSRIRKREYDKGV